MGEMVQNHLAHPFPPRYCEIYVLVSVGTWCHLGIEKHWTALELCFLKTCGFFLTCHCFPAKQCPNGISDISKWQQTGWAGALSGGEKKGNKQQKKKAFVCRRVMNSQSWAKQTNCYNENPRVLTLKFGCWTVVEGGPIKSFCVRKQKVKRELQKSIWEAYLPLIMNTTIKFSS